MHLIVSDTSYGTWCCLSSLCICSGITFSMHALCKKKKSYIIIYNQIIFSLNKTETEVTYLCKLTSRAHNYRNGIWSATLLGDLAKLVC